MGSAYFSPPPGNAGIIISFMVGKLDELNTSPWLPTMKRFRMSADGMLITLFRFIDMTASNRLITVNRYGRLVGVR